ncbi:hypothetical protein V9T40_003865 [Parthenolecanium corni]|uniref:Endothelin-converting enzyme 1 n=1 Tax=Parthenolecanium corni TaxID=536013 RepID=A0AAN9TTI4_9HEMI
MNILGTTAASESCNIPQVIRGQWFSLERGEEILTEFGSNVMSNKGRCVNFQEENRVNYTFVFLNNRNKCYSCVKIFVRTINVLEKIESGCVTLLIGEHPTINTVCKSMKQDQQLVTLFSENFVPVNCRSSIEGVWQFAYQDRYRFTGECSHPEAQIKSCQKAGAQFLITNQKFNVTYKSCPGMSGTFNGVVEYTCLGDWLVDKNHFFAVVNSKESRKDSKYRCFLKNRDDDEYIGVSNTAECNTLKSVDNSPVRLHVSPIKSENVDPGCTLPANFTGDWINTANSDADVTINETHIIETVYPYEGRFRRTVYVCREQRDTRYMMARLSVDGCQIDYVCFDFVPRHHNVIRYRIGVATIKENFHTVCSYVRFPNHVQWKYDLLLAKNPIPIRCPIAGKYKFKQKGEMPFVSRILGGLTQSPRPNIRCMENISDFSVCDTEQREITIDQNYCLSVDHLGRPVDIYSDPDYKMKCVGYWKENLKSYLITYDEMDAYSSFRCWVYQRTDLNTLLMSQSIGPFCNLEQDITSWNQNDGAAVGLELVEYERERDQCPMNFDDGSNPWLNNEIGMLVLDVGDASCLHSLPLLTTCCVVFGLFLHGTWKQNICQSKECTTTANRLSSTMDESVDPCDNFYNYACGNFGNYVRKLTGRENNPSSWIIASQIFLKRKIAEILKSNITESEPEALKKAKMFYRSCVDTDTMNSRGISPIRKVLKKMGISPSLYQAGQGNSFDWLSTAVKYKKYFNKDFLFCVNIRPEPENPDVNYISIEKPIEEEADFPKIVSKKSRLKQNFKKNRPVLTEAVTPVLEILTFVNRVAKMIDVGSGIENSTNYAEYIQIKTTLLLHLQQQNLKLMEKLYYFQLNWDRYFKLLFEGVENVDWEKRKNSEKIMVYDENYLRDIIAFIKEYSAHFESLLWFNTVQLLLFYTTHDLRKLAFEFINEQSTSMERTCRELAMESMDMAVAYPLINENGTLHKTEVTEMTDNLKYVLGKIVEKSSWLDDGTKNATYNKIKKMRSYVSHPFWLTNSSALDGYYKRFKVENEDFIQSVMNINEAIVKMNLETLQHPTYEQDFCGTNILEMNAFYFPRDNAMCIPTGIIQFPFFGHPIQVLNYGTLGTIVGHEITHGFDHETKFFAKKDLEENSTDFPLKEYLERKKCFIDAYNGIDVGIIGLTVNGIKTLKENIADHGGLEEAFLAYQLYVQKNGPEPRLPGFENFTHEQLFTLAFANLWCEETTFLELFLQLLSDVHSPNEARVIGALRNFKPFSEIWHCPAGSRMNPPKKCQLF